MFASHACIGRLSGSLPHPPFSFSSLLPFPLGIFFLLSPVFPAHLPRGVVGAIWIPRKSSAHTVDVAPLIPPNHWYLPRGACWLCAGLDAEERQKPHPVEQVGQGERAISLAAWLPSLHAPLPSKTISEPAKTKGLLHPRGAPVPTLGDARLGFFSGA